MKTQVILASGGISLRMQNKNKLLAKIGNIPVIIRTLMALSSFSNVLEIVLVVNKKFEDNYKKLIEKYEISKIEKIIHGGEKRQDSIWEGIKQLNPKIPFTAIHDAARPFITEELFNEILEQAIKYDCAIPAIPINDTIKQTDKKGFVDKTLDRAQIFAVQTPQIFKTELIIKAYEKIHKKEKIYKTDDCAIIEEFGKKVKMVKGDNNNIKITNETDLIIAEIIAQKKGDS